jgi:drug/metabolite transporter (DMT)-like permease
MSTAATRTRTHLYLALAAVYVIWGSTYLAMRIAVETLPPMLMGAGRFVLAGALLGGLARVTGTPWPRPRQWLAAVPIGALLFVGGNGLVALAETEVSSGLAALVCARPCRCGWRPSRRWPASGRRPASGWASR